MDMHSFPMEAKRIPGAQNQIFSGPDVGDNTHNHQPIASTGIGSCVHPIPIFILHTQKQLRFALKNRT